MRGLMAEYGPDETVIGKDAEEMTDEMKEEMRYQLAIFDMDGTILDTLDDLAASTNHALVCSGLPERTTDEVRRFVGNGVGELIDRAVPEGTDDAVKEKVIEDFRNHYGEHCFDRTGPYKGIRKCIDALKEAGMKVAVVSNKMDYAVAELCDRFFPGVFDAAVGEKEGIRRKPWPDSVEHVISQLGAAKEKTVYIGDSEVDIETAKNAGIDEIAVVWGFRNKDFLKERGASVLAESPEELLDALLK